MRSTCVFLTLFLIGSPESLMAGDTVSASGTIESVCTNCRTVTVHRNTRTRDKVGTFRLSDDAEITINGEEGHLDALAEGDTVTLTYDKATKRIVKVEGSTVAPAAKSPDHAADEKPPAKSARATVKRAAPAKLDTKFFARKLAGKPVYIAKTGELRLTYNFKLKRELDDFKVTGDSVVAQVGVLHIGPADAVEHTARFTELKVEGVFTIKNIPFNQDTALLRTTSGVSCVCDEYNGHMLTLVEGGKRRAGKHFDSIQGVPVPITFSVSDRKSVINATTLKEGRVEFGEAVQTGTPGRIELLGGKGGMEVRSLVISGKPDPEWLKELLGENSETADAEPAAPNRKQEKDWSGWVSLAANIDEFRQHWSRGDDRGNVYFDAEEKAIVIDSPWLLGKIARDMHWAEFYFEAVINQPSTNFDMKINGVTFKLGDAPAKIASGAEVRVKYDPKTKTATALVADQTVSRATILDDTWQKSFKCEFVSTGANNVVGNAKLTLRNLRLLPASDTRSAAE